MKILNVVGARPNFVKIAPLIHEMRKRPGIEPLLVHTGQHYDTGMSDVFFEQLGQREATQEVVHHRQGAEHLCV